MAIGKLLLKLGIDVSNLDKELRKGREVLCQGLDSKMSNVGSTLTQSLDIAYYWTWRSCSKILCRHGKA
jgi:hypothetical protein